MAASFQNTATLGNEMFARAQYTAPIPAEVTGVVHGTNSMGGHNILPIPEVASSLQFSRAPSMQTGMVPAVPQQPTAYSSYPPGGGAMAPQQMGYMSPTRGRQPTVRGGTHRTMNQTRGSTVDDMVDEAYMQLTTEAGDISRKWRDLQLDATHLQRKKLALRSDWAKLRNERAWLDDEKRRFGEIVLSEVAEFTDEPRLKLNVGGVIYETYESVLTRDPDSMLAALCRDDSPLKDEEKDMECVVFIDRSGILFRHVLNFLRDGVLPINKLTLKDLYREAKYFELNSLRTEIEKRLGIVSVAGSATRSIETSSNRMTRGKPLDDRSRWLAPGTPGGIDGYAQDVENRHWWERPSDHKGWWPSNKKGENKMDWWTSNSYNGKNFDAPLHQYSGNLNEPVTLHSQIGQELQRSRPHSKPLTSTWDSRPSYAQSIDLSQPYATTSSAVSRFR